MDIEIPDEDRQYLESLAPEWDLFYLRTYQAVLLAENLALDLNLSDLEASDPYRVGKFILLSGQSFYVRVENDTEVLADVLVKKGALPAVFLVDGGEQAHLTETIKDAVPPPSDEEAVVSGYRWHDLTSRREAIFTHWMSLVKGWKALDIPPEERWSPGVVMGSNQDLFLECYDSEGVPILCISADRGDEYIEEVVYDRS